MTRPDWSPLPTSSMLLSNVNNPAPAIDPSLQQQLDEIGGVMVDGRPKLRLIWGQDPQATVFWQGRQRFRYLAGVEREFVGWKAYELAGVKIYPPTVQPPKTDALVVERIWDEKDIGIPRWFIEQIMPAAIVCDGWDDVKMDVGEDGTIIDSLGPKPSDGFYEEGFYMVADHSNCCLNNSFTPGCKGEYRPPQQYDIEYVRWLVKQLNDEAFKYHWEDVPTPQTVVQSLLDRKTNIIHQKIRRVEEVDYGIRNSLLSLKGKTFGVRPVTVPDVSAIFNRARKF